MPTLPLILLLSALLLTSSAPDDSIARYYAAKNVAALDTLLQETDELQVALLCRYRLYPLTEDPRYLDDLPEVPPNGSARERALLSGLWGYRASRGSLFSSISSGRRAQRLLQDARSADPDDPLVLLIEGQSLLFRPRLAGGNPEAALNRFRQLEEILQERDDPAVERIEAQSWIWYTLRELGQQAAARELRDVLLEDSIPELYREFLLSS